MTRYLTPMRVKDYVSGWLRKQQISPANGGQWMISARVISYTAVTHPDTLSVYVYGWPASSVADVETLATALGNLPGLIQLQKWPKPVTLRPCVRLYISRELA